MPSKPSNGTLQFRSAGPMVLPDCTPAELSRVRSAVTMPDSKIKYIALCQRNDGSLLVFAQACEKLSVKAWRRFLGPRLQNVVPSADCIMAIKQCQGYEADQETGEFTRMAQGVTDPTLQCEEFGQTGWSKLLEQSRRPAVQPFPQGGAHDPASAQKQAESELERRYIPSESVRRLILEGMNCKTVDWMVSAYHATQRAAANALMEIHGLRPVF